MVVWYDATAGTWEHMLGLEEVTPICLDWRKSAGKRFAGPPTPHYPQPGGAWVRVLPPIQKSAHPTRKASIFPNLRSCRTFFSLRVPPISPIVAVYSQIALAADRTIAAGLKQACGGFQSAAGAFAFLRETVAGKAAAVALPPFLVAHLSSA
uniref:Uncharacterized protein n=1 Tax=Ananas comosus var. bracteatus TaxID=296719 RepID=A0A6V7PS13_ANACO|nr:unnamed protein product [Ananas comosus var. bracteatus]